MIEFNLSTRSKSLTILHQQDYLDRSKETLILIMSKDSQRKKN